ncbi:DNA translocase FtsK 4TM domain-containing protein [Candidatus Berkelbacteria bacterium]|nr:DNA translocase FtsK 4TM domain-containing protein [Candidatus Berkelbacteria bacterium]
MPRRKKHDQPQNIDFSVEPKLAAEVVAVILLLLAILFLLAIFGLAGGFGATLLHGLTLTFGLSGFLVPFVLAGSGYVFWRSRQLIVRPHSVVGIILSLIFFPALFFQAGGVVGGNVSEFFVGVMGPVAAFVVLLGLTIISLILATNLSISQLKSWLVPEPEKPDVRVHEAGVSVFATVRDRLRSGRPATAGPVVAKPRDLSWNLPAFELLHLSTSRAQPGNIAKNVEVIGKTLKDFGVSVTMGDVNIGPTVTQYTLKPADGVKLAAITARTNDLSLALAAHPIRIEAPIPGKAAVGLEVPNKVPAEVTLREVLESDQFRVVKSTLTLALGRDVAGTPFAVDVQKMPHLLIAGSTGAGKSIALHGMMMSMLFQNSPAMLRLILIDPKRVEFTHYNDIPHLLTPVVTQVGSAVNALRWAISEMERRFALFQETGRRDIVGYNQNPPDGPLPYIVITIDELADLMAQAGSEIEAAIVRLAQMARATGIHLIVATQRPSVDVITGLIKANITTRVAFAVASQVDSRTIIDQAGAERLLSRGDMLYLSPELGKPKRVQGVMVRENEIKAVTEFIKSQAGPEYDESIAEFRPTKAGGFAGSGDGGIDDELYEEAKQVVIAAGKASASLLQRRLRVGYARAARLLDLLEEQGVIGPAEGARPRDVLISDSEREQYRVDEP